MTKTKKKTVMKLLCVVAVLLLAGFVWSRYFWFDTSHDALIKELSAKYGLPHELVYSVVKAESNFRPNAVSQKGAKGLMQLMPDTARFAAQELGMTKIDLTDEEQNLQMGVFYLHYLLQKFGSEDAALAAYNAGEKVAAKWMKNGKLDHVPYPETQNYLNRVGFFKKVFCALYN